MPNPKPGGRYGLRHQALLPSEPGEPRAQLPEKRAPPRALTLEPQLELGGALQREALHELSPVESQIALQPADELPASPGSGAASSSCQRAFPPCQRDGRFERLQVELHPPRLQSQKVVVDDEGAG